MEDELVIVQLAEVRVLQAVDVDGGGKSRRR